MEKRITVGMDMGDKNHSVCILDAGGEVQERTSVTNTLSAIQKYFKDFEPSLIALEAGTHSAWVSRILEEMGHEVLVGNPRKLRAIWDSDDKGDDRDAELLARIARLDPKLMHPIRHRSEDAQMDLGIIKARDILVKTRTTLTAHVRVAMQGVGAALPLVQRIEGFGQAVVSTLKRVLHLFRCEPE